MIYSSMSIVVMCTHHLMLIIHVSVGVSVYSDHLGIILDYPEIIRDNPRLFGIIRDNPQITRDNPG
jgi:hypothetical protein